MKPSVIQIGIATKRVARPENTDLAHSIEMARNKIADRKRSQSKFSKAQMDDAIAEFKAKENAS